MIQPAIQSDTAIRVRGLSKAYTIQKGGLEKQSTLAEAALSRFRNPFRRAERETFYALRDIDLDIKKGEVVGIIGRNGAGKSTLLKVLSRITYPTTGEIDLFGRVGSLLEVGTGFHPELTGRENIYLNGAILGMARSEIKSEFDAIVNFASVEKFLDTPVKRYSSGMYVRLAFAVAAHLRTEILIVDEVLAVGDAEFQQKCIGKMQEVAGGQGRSVIFISHQMQTIQQLCTRAMMLRAGQVVIDSNVSEVVRAYLAEGAPEQESVAERTPRGIYGFCRAQLTQPMIGPEDDLTLSMELGPGEAGGQINERFFISVEVIDIQGRVVLHLDSRALGSQWSAGRYQRLRLTVRAPRLAAGRYFVNLYACTIGGILDRYEQAVAFEVAPEVPYPAGRPQIMSNAVYYPDFDFKESAPEAAEVPPK